MNIDGDGLASGVYFALVSNYTPSRTSYNVLCLPFVLRSISMIISDG